MQTRMLGVEAAATGSAGGVTVDRDCQRDVSAGKHEHCNAREFSCVLQCASALVAVSLAAS